MRDHPSSFSRGLRSFRGDARGGVALLVAFALIPLLLAIGSATDYTRATALRAKLQAGTDGAALALAKKLGTLDESGLKDLAQTFIAKQTDDPSTKITAFEIASDKSRIAITAAAASPNAFMHLAGMRSLTVQAHTTASINDASFEIALVLDNSGSMAASAGGESKMQAAINAANRLVDTMLTGPSANRTKISIVPFTLSVQVGKEYANANWMDRLAQSSIHFQNFEKPPAGLNVTRFDLFTSLNIPWGGCVESRPGDWGVTDAPPDPASPDSLFVPQAAPDEPGNAGESSSYGSGNADYPNSYLDDSPKPECEKLKKDDSPDEAQTRICKYMAGKKAHTAHGRGPNYSCDARPLVRLTNSTTTLRTSINGMVANGNTNLFEGFMWGWRTLSPSAPFSDGKPYGTQNLNKIIILMTDGMNAWASADNHNGSIYSPFGYYRNARLGPAPANATQARAQIDAKTLTGCTNAKARGIIVYTVGFSVKGAPIDAGGLDLLKKCASSESKAYVANNGAQFAEAFDEIARQLGTVRLSQ